jgi:hypothetical protein
MKMQSTYTAARMLLWIWSPVEKAIPWPSDSVIYLLRPINRIKFQLWHTGKFIRLFEENNRVLKPAVERKQSGKNGSRKTDRTRAIAMLWMIKRLLKSIILLHVCKTRHANSRIPGEGVVAGYGKIDGRCECLCLRFSRCRRFPVPHQRQ